jgi:hypothetical protein
MRISTIAGAVFATALSFSTANADIVLSSGVGSFDQNVIFQNVVGNNSMSLTTDTNSNPANRVTFTSSTEAMTILASGQAILTDTLGDGFTNLTWFMADTSLGFLSNVFSVNSSYDGLIRVQAWDQFGPDLDTSIFAVGANGSNFFTLTGTKGEIITKVTITALGTGNFFEDVRQERLVGVSAVPEPSTWAMMILGFLGLGFLGYRKSVKGTSAAFRMV